MPYFSIFAAIAAVVMGHITQKKIKANLAGGSGMKTAGLITGYIGLVIAVFMLGVMILAQFNPDFAKKLEEMQNKQKQKIESQQR
jgi:ABC-type Na+ efflux pump permease subunit